MAIVIKTVVTVVSVAVSVWGLYHATRPIKTPRRGMSRKEYLAEFED